MTIPSALTLLVNVFPDPLQQAWAIGLFGGCGAIAVGEKSPYLIFMTSLMLPLVFGLLIGAIFIEWASYHWVFWFVAIVAIAVALLGWFFIPPQVAETPDRLEHEAAKWNSLDLVGVSILTGMNIPA